MMDTITADRITVDPTAEAAAAKWSVASHHRATKHLHSYARFDNLQAAMARFGLLAEQTDAAEYGITLWANFPN